MSGKAYPAPSKKLEAEQEIPTDKQCDIWKNIVCWACPLVVCWEVRKASWCHAWCKTKQCCEMIGRKTHMTLSSHVEMCLFGSLAKPVQAGQVSQQGSLFSSWHLGLSLRQMSLCWSKTLVSSKHPWRRRFKVGNVAFSPPW